MKVVKVLVVLALAVFCLIFVGCKQQNDVTGMWKNVNIPETLEFRKDRTGTFTVKNNPSLQFKWKSLPDGRVELDVAFMGKNRVLYGKMEKNTFILSGNGEQAVYSRAY